jgi:DNA-directed RNA polymerase II subunit RPB1
MNIHSPQSLLTLTELKYNSATKYKLVNPQNSKLNMAIVQDALLGAYLMTVNIDDMTREDFFDLSMKAYYQDAAGRDVYGVYSTDRMKQIEKVFSKFDKQYARFNCYSLISLILPEDLVYEKTNNSDVLVKIYKGVLYEGVIDKSILGSSHNSLPHVLVKEYGNDVASRFIDNIQFMANNWLLIYGFSIGLEDCMLSDSEKMTEIKDVIKKHYIEAKAVDTIMNPAIKEIRVHAALNKAKDLGMKIAKDTMTAGGNNNLMSAITSGSKGDFFNIAQLTGLLGQQNIKGSRINKQLGHYSRTLPHYGFKDLTLEEEFESRGFVHNSFTNGLNAKEFFFHAISGRDGICDTALGTASSGYIQRRLIKVSEDIQIHYDTMVRGSSGRIYSFTYGNDNLDLSKTIKVNGEQQFINVENVVNRLLMVATFIYKNFNIYENIKMLCF